jgi:hypothetical protein
MLKASNSSRYVYHPVRHWCKEAVTKLKALAVQHVLLIPSTPFCLQSLLLHYNIFCSKLTDTAKNSA